MNKISIFIISIITIFSVFTLPVFAQAVEQPTYEQNLIEKPIVQKVNINQADAEEFVQLKGIGEKKAQAIVEYRKLNGTYNSLDDLLKVKGIGKKILLNNKMLLTI